MSLYEIGEEFRALCKIDDAVTDEDADALLALFSEVQARFDAKAAAVAAYITNLESEAAAFGAEALRLSSRKAALERKADWLKDYLARAMRENGVKEVKAGLFSAKFVKNPWAVEIEPGAKIPEEYMRIPPPLSPAPDKPRIAEALKGGAQIDGVRLVQTERLKIN